MQYASGDLAPTGDGVSDGVDGEFRGHPIADGVPDDAVREHVLDRAAVQLALGGPVLRDVGEPEPVRRISAEHPLDMVVEHGRPGLLALPASPPLRRGEDPSLRAQLPRRPPAHPPPRSTSFVGEVSVAERRVSMVRVMQRVDPIRAEHIGVPDRVVSPPVVGLAGELEDPARHRHGNPRVGELRYERVRHFGEPPRRRFACDRYAAARRSTSFSCSSSRIRFFSSRASAASATV